ncbi:Hypothetical protein R9X50_00714600 [Acrodontium crateriforme]|uniref:Rap-GAP domain-containing protein n=1 Tax=Acrodontium crateriforme TaxID=150365 RepID=A0AAQ3M981_9PEZI|nr:Hypothetical protein R9X50_00714600 [Acrodontium crateriforme]
MASQDGPNTPEWNPISCTSSLRSSAASSSILRPSQPLLPVLADFRSLSSNSEHVTWSANDGGDGAAVGRDIAPLEPVTCHLLTETIRSFLSPPHLRDQSLAIRAPSLEAALQQATVTIRYNAKWFAPGPVSSLILTSLEAASASSSSADLYAALALIDTVGTYSLLPSSCLLPVARFISHAYHQGSRSNRLKRLSEESWAVSAHILQTHLSEQFIAALLSIIRDDLATFDRRTGYGHTAGALKILSDRLLFTKFKQPKVSLTAILGSLKSPDVRFDVMIREQIMELLVRILSDHKITQDLSKDAGWERVLDLVVSCVTSLPKNSALALPLVDAVTPWMDQFEARQLASVSRAFVHAGRMLTPSLHREFVFAWSRALPLPHWTAEFDDTMTQLCSAPHYAAELEPVVNKSMAIFLQSEDVAELRDFVEKYKTYIYSPATTPVASAIIGDAFVNTFRYCMEGQTQTWRRVLLFETLCDISDHSLDAARMLFRLRADITGAVYFKARPVTPLVVQSTPTTTVLYHAQYLPIEKFHDSILRVILNGTKTWETYDCFLFSLPYLLSNHKMFEGKIAFIEKLKKALSDHLEDKTILEPPKDKNLSKYHSVGQHVQILTTIMSYHRYFSKSEIVHLVSLFNNTAGSGDYAVSKQCIHALTVCCYEVPSVMTNCMDDVIDKMARMVTQRSLAIHVLQFLASVSRLPDLYRNFTQIDYKKIFGVCQSYLQSTVALSNSIAKNSAAPSDNNATINMEEALPHYVYALAHHIITFWYIAMKPQDRAGLKKYITHCLTYKSVSGMDIVEDQGLVTIDMMDRVDAEAQRSAADESGENHSVTADEFTEVDGRLIERHRLAGLLLISTKTALRTSKTLVTTRRASGTMRQLIQKNNSLAYAAAATADIQDENYLTMVPEDVLGSTYGKIFIPSPSSPLGSFNVVELPESDAVRRAIESFDRTSALDSHKAGVIYIGEGQTSEDVIFQNISGSFDYNEFISGLGDVQRLRGATFNTQGLDRTNDTDGEYAIVWDNEVTEMVFHITTLMPNSTDIRENTPRKKRHIGNDFVNIIFNNSGTRLTFDALATLFPSSFSYVYIVVTPSARTSFIEARSTTAFTTAPSTTRFYKVQVLAASDYPTVSPAVDEKVVSGASLPGFVRNLALNDCMVALMKSPRSDPGEYPSSWRNRLEQLRRMAMRYGSAA